MPPDYSGQNLQGRSFKGQNLTGASFRNADIRGTNFTNAILKDADFTSAKAGLQQHWIIGLLIVSWLLSGLSGFLSIIIGVSVAYISDTKNLDNFTIGVISLVLLVVFCIVSIRKGLTVTLGAGAVAVSFAGAFAFAFVFAGSFAVAFAFAFAGTVAGAFAFAFAFAGTGTGTVALVGAFAVAVAVALTKAGDFAVAVAVTFARAGVFTVPKASAFTVAFAFTLFSAYIGWRSLAGDEKDTWLYSTGIAFAAIGGTSFRGANLINVDFTGAILKNTDFRKANLTRTRFFEAKKLDFARVDDTILANQAVLNLLVTCNGRGKSYADVNLRGANLKHAELNKANLKGADMIAATFEGACLEWANLTITQAIDTDFTNAQMTGACIEAWNIDSTTKLHNVDCRFIYLLEYSRLGTDDRERRPSSGDFQSGEFTKLFEEVLNTVDLIFRNGIDWKAFVAAFKQVQVENQDTELAIQSIENKGDGVVVVKVAVPVDADKEKIHSDFTQNYQLALQAVEEKYKAQLQAKDEQIVVYRQQSGEMAEIVKLLANKPINVQVDNKVENKNMTNSNDSSRKFENSGTLNNSGTINLGEISGAVTNTINELPPSPEPGKPGIKELLTQLQAAIEADTNLNKEDKADALEQVKALAEAGKNPQEGGMQKGAKTAIKILKGTIASLPSATKLVEECSNLLPLISSFLGLG
ncbi:hypothetical protein FACHB389_33085 [Nostoc calcicola FACHB-389]|nr:pentapeptide repeat-containing protein [Nostoc calcicola FACHB-3891]OKH20184.1 hypothetical protein FACHB389_33085 [Nostoc calcicola FACHB-389]